LPEACLLADVSQVFGNRKVDFCPPYLHDDVRDIIETIHSSGELHNMIMLNPALFLDKNSALGDYLLSLRACGKMTFLLTNSPLPFVNVGLQYMLSDWLSAHHMPSWRQLFDVIIVSAKKPSFYHRSASFRKVNIQTGLLSVESVNSFDVGSVYSEGSLQEFTRITNKTGHHVIYMGDHIFSDLMAPSKTARWKTAAIIKEIRPEIQKMNSPAFNSALNSLLDVDRLIRFGQRCRDPESKFIFSQLKSRREQLKRTLYEMSNTHFGSVFRTTSHRSEFFSEVCRFADIYTSAVTNFSHYPTDYCFYVDREFFPHENHPSWQSEPSEDDKQ